MKRFTFLDWMRGFAVIVMIQCHTFNSWTRPELARGGPYMLSQFVGGMAAPLFLFMAGVTFGFQMDSLDRREPRAIARWLAALRRGAYILGIAFAFRTGNFVASLPHPDPNELIKVDILNCMGVGMLVLSLAALWEGSARIRYTLAAGLVIAAASPLVANLPWDGAPRLLREYVAAIPGLGRFAFFPFAAYVAFGLATGGMIRRAAAERFERFMQWSVLAGLTLAFTARYFADLPFSLYPKSDFWSDSPALVLIRLGVILLILTGSYLWAEMGAGPGWSWVQTLGRHSLMVYWVHVMLVYGDLIKPLKRSLNIPQATVATLALVLLMLALAAAAEWWKTRRSERSRARTTAAKNAIEPARG